MTKPDPHACWHCHRGNLSPDRTAKVRVIANDDGAQSTLTLCTRCATVRDATWRRRYRQVAGGGATPAEATPGGRSDERPTGDGVHS